MNGRLNKHVVTPRLASAISFALIAFFFASSCSRLPFSHLPLATFPSATFP